MDIIQRTTVAQEQRLCYNCLRNTHIKRTCLSGCCRLCQRKHHTLLHYEHQYTKSSDNLSSSAPCASAPSTIPKQHPATASSSKPSSSDETDSVPHILLSTAWIRIKASNGSYELVRALLDSGSQASFITEKCVSLKLTDCLGSSSRTSKQFDRN